MMTGACYHLSPTWVIVDKPFEGTVSFDCRCKDTMIFGIYQNLACDKERFSAAYDLKLS